MGSTGSSIITCGCSTLGGCCSTLGGCCSTLGGCCCIIGGCCSLLAVNASASKPRCSTDAIERSKTNKKSNVECVIFSNSQIFLSIHFAESIQFNERV